MNQPPPPQSLFLACEPDPLFATLHAPGARTRSAAVILCPPFGWEEVCSYRPLRSWAERLAGAGHPALRLSLPGTGDSGGQPRDGDQVAAWVAAVSAATTWLRDTTGARRLAVVGLGTGGVAACLAAADGAAIDDLALWATPARGRDAIRHLRAFSKLERSQFYAGLGAPPPTSEDELEAGGFVLTAATLAALGAIDLKHLSLPETAGRRALLLERDGLAVDAELRERLEAIGVAVTTAPGDGYADMTSHPQTARPAEAAIARVLAWLDDAQIDAAVGATGHAGAPLTRSQLTPHESTMSGAPAASTAHLHGPGRSMTVRETIVTIPERSGRLAGIVSEPADGSDGDLCVVLLNAGAVRRIGPSRMWVEAARRWAADGLTVLRLDLEAIGDADGDETPYREDGALYGPQFVPQVRTALDFLQQRGLGQRFLLGGLCSGAFWSFHAALGDARVQALALLNPRALIWSSALAPGRDLRALLTQRPSPRRLRRLATGPRLHAFLRWLARAPARLVIEHWSGESETAATARRLDHALERLLSSGPDLLLLFSEHEPLCDEMERSGRLRRLANAGNVTLERVRVRDHTMRPGWAQREVHRALDRAVAAVRARPAASDPTASTASSGRVDR